MEFLSDEWLSALADAARSRTPPDDDPLADVELVVEQVVTGGPRWRLVVERGQVRIDRAAADDPPADVRLTSDRSTATAIASGRRAALDAFITGDLTIGGDVRILLERGAALETMGDLFGQLRAATTFDDA